MIKEICVACNKKTQFIINADTEKGRFIYNVPEFLTGLGAVESLAGGAAGNRTTVHKSKTANNLRKKIRDIIKHNVD